MKKTFKKLITILMSLLICIGIGATAVFADDGNTTTNGDKDITVTTTVDQSYIWYMTPTLSNATGSIKVGVTDNTIAYGNQLKISYEGNNDDADGKHYLVDANNADNKLQYSITGFVSDNDGVALIAPAGELKDNTLTVALEDTAVYSGTYKDYLTFTLEIVGAKSAANNNQFLTFSSKGAFTLGLSMCYAQGLEVSTDAVTWTPFNSTGVEVSAVQKGDKYYIYLRGKDMTTLADIENEAATALKITPATEGDLTEDDLVDCSGNIMTLLDYKNPDKVVMDDGAFALLFMQCEALKSAPELPATTLSPMCYYGMFYLCENMTVAPELPAKTLATACYSSMFQGCFALTTVNDLPATVLAEDCYRNMFCGCESLTEDLRPATAVEVDETTAHGMYKAGW